MNDYKIYLIDDDGAFAQLEIESIDFSTTYSINDLTDISKRKDAISKNLKIFGTKNNNRVFGNLFNLNTSVESSANLYFNYKANKQTDCIIYENNIVVMKGQMSVLEVTKQANNDIIYDCIVSGHVVKFFNQISELELSDLTYDTTSHTYDINTIKNSWTGSTSYIYPTIDYGAVSKYQNNFDFRNFRGGIYLKTYFDAIFKTFGYTYSSSFTNSDLFKKCFIPYTEKVYGRNVLTKLYNATQASQSISRTVSGTIRNRYFGKSIRFTNAVSNSILAVKNTAKDSENEQFQSFQFARLNTTSGKVKFNFTASGTFGSSFDFEILPVENGNVNYEAPIGKTNRFVFTSGVTTISDVVEMEIPFKEYPEFTEFVILMKNLSMNGTVTINITNLDLSLGDINVKSVVENRIDDVLTIKNILPDGIKVYQFLTDILKIFNLFITINPQNEKEFIIEDYDRFYAKALYPKTSAIDWSSKLDNEVLTSTFNLVIPKKYNFKFKEDSSNYWLNEYKKKYNENFGDAVIKNEDGYSDETSIEIQFSSTIVVQNSVDSKVMPNIFIGDPNDKKETYKSNFRLLFNNGVADCSEYVIGLYPATGTATTYSAVNATYNVSSPILKDSSGNDVFHLSFGVPKEVYAPVNQSIFALPNIYSSFYQNQLTELVDSNFRTFQCEVWLDENDISNLDFQTPIYLATQNLGNTYFKLLEVNYKSSKELSKVKLQKIIL